MSQLIKTYKSLPTFWNGQWFRSQKETRWAIFFTVCGLQMNRRLLYEETGFKVESVNKITGEIEKVFYRPDFILRDVPGFGDLYVEVKGRMNEEDAKKITDLYEAGKADDKKISDIPILVVGNLPNADKLLEDTDPGKEMEAMLKDMYTYNQYNSKPQWPQYYNLKTITGDDLAVYPGLDDHNHFRLFPDKSEYLRCMNTLATRRAFDRAHGELLHGHQPSAEPIRIDRL